MDEAQTQKLSARLWRQIGSCDSHDRTSSKKFPTSNCSLSFSQCPPMAPSELSNHLGSAPSWYRNPKLLSNPIATSLTVYSGGSRSRHLRRHKSLPPRHAKNASPIARRLFCIRRLPEYLPRHRLRRRRIGSLGRPLLRHIRWHQTRAPSARSAACGYSGDTHGHGRSDHGAS